MRAFASPRFQGYFCEMIIYERALTPTELSTEVEYLSRKYNLDTTTP